MQIAIEVPTLTSDQIQKWMLKCGWEIVVLANPDEQTVLSHPQFKGFVKLRPEMRVMEIESLLRYLNFGHPTRTLLELWAEIQEIPELMNYTIEALLAPVD